MKTKTELLKMSKDELLSYMENSDLNVKKIDIEGNNNCFSCLNCFSCSNCYRCYGCSRCYGCYLCYCCYGCYRCSDCFECFACQYLSDKKYMICNVQFTKEEYEQKMKEIKETNNTKED